MTRAKVLPVWTGRCLALCSTRVSLQVFPCTCADLVGPTLPGHVAAGLESPVGAQPQGVSPVTQPHCLRIKSSCEDKFYCATVVMVEVENSFSSFNTFPITPQWIVARKLDRRRCFCYLMEATFIRIPLCIEFFLKERGGGHKRLAENVTNLFHFLRTLSQYQILRAAQLAGLRWNCSGWKWGNDTKLQLNQPPPTTPAFAHPPPTGSPVLLHFTFRACVPGQQWIMSVKPLFILEISFVCDNVHSTTTTTDYFLFP